MKWVLLHKRKKFAEFLLNFHRQTPHGPQKMLAVNDPHGKLRPLYLGKKTLCVSESSDGLFAGVLEYPLHEIRPISTLVILTEGTDKNGSQLHDLGRKIVYLFFDSFCGHVEYLFQYTHPHRTVKMFFRYF